MLFSCKNFMFPDFTREKIFARENGKLGNWERQTAENSKLHK